MRLSPFTVLGMRLCERRTEVVFLWLVKQFNLSIKPCAYFATFKLIYYHRGARPWGMSLFPYTGKQNDARKEEYPSYAERYNVPR